MRIKQGLRDTSLSLNRCIKDPIICYGGGGKGGSTVQTVQAKTTPAPEPASAATMTEYTDPNTAKEKQKAKTQGATSLQIPLGGVTSSSSIGTV